jgi:flagellar assembly protein FliH
LQQATAHVQSVLRCLERPLEKLDESVERALVDLAMSVGRHIVRRELKIDPGQVIAVVREAVAELPVAARRVQLYLHPDDAALLKERLALHDTDSHWELIGDPAVSRGGCRVVSETSQIDATVENRVAAVVARIMGDERDG